MLHMCVIVCVCCVCVCVYTCVCNSNMYDMCVHLVHVCACVFVVCMYAHTCVCEHVYVYTFNVCIFTDSMFLLHWS